MQGANTIVKIYGKGRSNMKDERAVAKIILLAGQSNADGVAHNCFVEEKCGAQRHAQLCQGYENVRMMAHSECDGVRHIHSTVINNDVPIKLGQCCTTSFGPELGMAEYLSQSCPDETFYIVKHAIGGSCLAHDWYVGQDGAPHGVYLRAFLQKIDNALAYVDRVMNKRAEIVAFVWMQGESDGDSARAPKYFDRQMALVQHVRERYKYYAAEMGIAFIDGGISAAARDGKTNYYWPEYKAINEAKRRMAALSDMNYYVDTIGAGMTTYEDNKDYAHYGVRSQLILGHLFGECIKDVMGKYEQPEPKSVSDKPLYPTQTELVARDTSVDAAGMKKVIDNVDFPIVGTRVSEDGGELVITFMKDTPSIRIVRYSVCARYLTLEYSSNRDMSITVYPNPTREVAVGGEEIYAKLENGARKTLKIDLCDSPEFVKYGPFVSSLMIRFNDAVTDERISFHKLTFSGK